MTSPEDWHLLHRCSKMDKFTVDFASANINKDKLGRELIKFLNSNPITINNYLEIGSFIESLGNDWVANQNSKVSQYGLEALVLIAEAMQKKYKDYAGLVLQHAITKFGDNKESLREKARTYLLKTVGVGAQAPNHLLEKIVPLLSNKNKDMSAEAQRAILELLQMCKNKKLTSNVLNDLVKAEINSLGTHLREDAAIILMDLAERIGKSPVIKQLENEVDNFSGRNKKKILTLIEELKSTQTDHHGAGGVAALDDDDELNLDIPKPKRVKTAPKSEPKATSGVAALDDDDELNLDIHKPKRVKTAPKSEPKATSGVAALDDDDELNLDIPKPKRVKTAPKSEPKATSGVAALDDDDELNLDIHKPKRVKTAPKSEPKATSGMASKGALSRTGSVRGTKIGEGDKYALHSGMASKGALSRTGSVRGTKIGEGDKYALHSGPTGEADEDWFRMSFEDVPEVSCVNRREFRNLSRKIKDDLESGAEFWEIKIEALKRLRSIILYRIGLYDPEIHEFIKNIALLLMNTLKDLRSQVVRETCLTFAFICKELKNDVGALTCETIIQQLMSNVMSSAKVIASASYIAIKFILTYVNHSGLIKTLVQTLLNSKSREVRTAACEFLDLILHTWPVHQLEKQIPSLQEGIKKGITEPSTTMAARKAFWAFRAHFPNQGDALLKNMDAICRKKVLAGGVPTENPPNSSKTTRHVSSSARPTVTRQPSSGGVGARGKKIDTPMSGPERSSRTRVSHSQPSSRSGSLSSRPGYHTYYMPESNTLAYQSRRGIPRSQSTSRETSLNRFGATSSFTNLFGSKRL